MADRVHPIDESSKPTPPESEKPVVSPIGTYVIQIPKDQIYRFPPPENAYHYQNYTRRKNRRTSGVCCHCLCWIISLITLLIILTAIAAAIFYFVYRPESPKYTVEGISIKGLNISSSSISPEFDVTIRANNPNDKIGIYYEKGSYINVFYSGVKLCDGALTEFYQPKNNVTVLKTSLKGSGLMLGNTIHEEMVKEQNGRKINFVMKLKAPVKIKVGSVKTWTINIKVKCRITVDELTAESKIVSKDCDYSVELW